MVAIKFCNTTDRLLIVIATGYVMFLYGLFVETIISRDAAKCSQ